MLDFARFARFARFAHFAHSAHSAHFAHFACLACLARLASLACLVCVAYTNYVMPRTVLVLVGPEYEDLEVWYPKLRLEEAGFEAPLGGLGDPSYRGKHGYPCTVDGHAKEWRADELAGIVAPGGWAPDKIRRDRHVLKLVQEVNEAGGLIATICHGPWILISAGIVSGRRLTSTVGIRDDLTNAGATWCDEPVVVDGNIISSRVPRDLPAFMRATVDWLRAP